MAEPVARYSRVLVTAGSLSLLLLVVAGLRGVTLPEWLSHLCISVAVVAIVHLLDRYLFMSETRQELAELSTTIIKEVSTATRDALDESTQALNTSVSERSARLLEETRASLNEILITQSESLKAMEASGIRKIYASRGDASGPIARLLNNGATREIRIQGISLNDFCRGDQPTLHKAWQALKKRIEAPGNGSSTPLKVRFLLIDPNSSSAVMRSFAESRGRSTEHGRLSTEVHSTAEALYKLEQLQKAKGITFECRLYRSGPGLFLCHTDESCFVQQYHFWTERLHDTPIPVLEYVARPMESVYQMHGELGQHFDVIWDHGSVSLADFLQNASVGVDLGAGETGLVNIFTDRHLAAKRILHLLRTAKNRVLLQGISLKSFFNGNPQIRAEMLDMIYKAKVKMRVLVLDPECDQAIYRSYRERLLQPQAHAKSFAEYKSSDQHMKSHLFTDTDDTLKSVEAWIQDLLENSPNWTGDFEMRRYDSAPACFMLLVDDRVLVEPYNYGKIGMRREGVGAPMTLGTDMPLFEYCKTTDVLFEEGADALRNPFELLRNHFKFVFDHALPCCGPRPH